jgi:inosine/xanthosine triphosphate pyrophosphatase family protein
LTQTPKYANVNAYNLKHKNMSPENNTPKHSAENTINVVDATSTEFKIPVLVDDEPTSIPRAALGLSQEGYSRRQEEYEQQYAAQESRAAEVAESQVEEASVPQTAEQESVADLTSKAIEAATGPEDLLNIPTPRQEGADYGPTHFTPLGDSSKLPQRK